MHAAILDKLGIKEVNTGATTGSVDDNFTTHGSELVSASPIDGRSIARVTQASADDYQKVMQKALKAFQRWSMTPAPQRGQVIRDIGDRLREAGGEFGEWVQVGIALESESLLMNQLRGIQLEYRVKAVNASGQSVPSNTVAVVL